jgi:putative colanic acid biosynthesis acetyltransferase WcaF
MLREQRVEIVSRRSRRLTSTELADDRSPLLIDPAGNQRARKYSRREQWRRVAWAFGRWLVVLSPRPMFGWRRAVLRLFGATVGEGVRIYSSTRIEMPWNVEIGDWTAFGEHAHVYSLGRVTIGRCVTVSYRAHVCAGTHEFTDPTLPLLKPPVQIESGVWIGTEAFVGPGVTVGEGALLGARAVVTRDVAPLDVVAGNPARVIGRRPPVKVR